MADAKPWVFSQVGGNKTVTLDGWSAPFGRPRHGAIVNAGTKVRSTITYYAGNDSPTVHTFGIEPKPFHLHGRWMDSAIGAAGGARALAAAFKALVADQKEVIASWGEVLSYRIFIHDLDAEFESDAEVAWALEAHVLVDEQAPRAARAVPAANPADLANQIASALSGANLPSLPTAIRALQGQLATDLTDLLDSVAAPFVTLADTCFAMQDFVSASLTDLGQILATSAQLKAAYLSVRDTTDVMIANIGAQASGSLSDPSGLYLGQDVLSATASKTDSDVDIANLMALIESLHDQATAASVGRPTTTYRVQNGDSWETISTKTLGSPSGAGAIADLNGAQYGSRPQPGSVIKIPSQG